jgi:hypothetical protein
MSSGDEKKYSKKWDITGRNIMRGKQSAEMMWP